MKPHLLERETKLYRPLPEIFAFFSNAENLGKVTPAEVQFTILTPFPIRMHIGTLIDYRIKLMGIPFFWRTVITDYDPPHRFVDQQLKGPYVFWHHEHSFEQKNGYVLMTDRVHYLSPGGFLEPLVDALFVKKQLDNVWAYRDKTFTELFGAHTAQTVQGLSV